MEGKHSGADVCTILKFFKNVLLVDDNRPAEEVVEWRIEENGNFVQRRFYYLAKERVSALLLSLCDIILLEETGVILFKAKASGERVTYGQLNQVMLKLEERLLDKDAFNYEKLVTTMVRECLLMIGRLCGAYIPHKELEAIKPQQIQFNGGDMVPYEIDFMGSLQTLIWPDPNLFMPEHYEFLQSSGGPGYTVSQVKKDYYYKALFYPLHELVHCIQMELKQTDGTAWATEHDASRLALALLEGLAKEVHTNKELAELLPPGKVEEVVLYVIDRVKKEGKDLSEKDIADYKLWRDTWGVKAPFELDAFESAFSRNSYTVYLKWRVGLEGYLQTLVAESEERKRKSEGTGNEKECEKQEEEEEAYYLRLVGEMLDASLKDRTGDITLNQVVVPLHAQISDRAELETILKPGKVI